MSLFLQTLLLRGLLFSEQEHRQEHMNLGAPGKALPAGMQASSGKESGTRCRQVHGLARGMAGNDRRKARQGRTSRGQVFNLILMENRMLAGVLSGTPNTGAQPAPITDSE